MSTPFGVDRAYQDNSLATRVWIRRTLIVIGVFVAANVAAVLVSSWLDPRTDGPFGSSYVTTEQGVGAWHDVLVELGHDVDRSRVPVGDLALGSSDVFVVVDPEPDLFTDEYTSLLLDHADAGGRVVVVGAVSADQTWDQRLAVTETVESDVRVTSGTTVDDVHSLAVGPSVRLSSANVQPLVTDDDGVIVARFPHGAGDVIAVSDPRLFTNEQFGDADNAILAVRLVDSRSVVFDEYVHGFQQGAGATALGRTIQTVLIVGVLASVLAMWAVGKRFGPVEQKVRALPPPRGDFLDAMAESLSRADDQRAYSVLRDRALADLDGPSPAPTAADRSTKRRAAASRYGLTDEELAALESDRGDVMKVAAAAAKIETRRGGSGWMN